MYKSFSLLTISLLLLSCENSNKQSSQNQNNIAKEKSTIGSIVISKMHTSIMKLKNFANPYPFTKYFLQVYFGWEFTNNVLIF